MPEPTAPLAAARRARKALDDGRCRCGHYRALCSPMGEPCCYGEDPDMADREVER